MKKIVLRILVFAAVIVIIFSPYLLVIDYKKYSPLVLIIWIVSIAYYILLRRRRDRQLRDRQNEEEEPEQKNVSRET